MQTLLVATAAGSTSNDESTTAKTLTEADYKKAALILGVEVAAIKTVASVESKGGGFLSNGMPKILFEGHWFSKLTQGQFDKKYPWISHKTWTKKFYRGGASEYERYNSAKTLDKNAAMKATSWGMFQIMGFNHKQCGFDTVDAFVSAMHVSEGFQLAAFAKFIKSSKLDLHLKNKNWASFAKSYNGPGDHTFTAEVEELTARTVKISYETMWMCLGMPSPDFTHGSVVFDISSGEQVKAID